MKALDDKDVLVGDHGGDDFVDALDVQLVDGHCDHDLADLLVGDLLLLDDLVVCDDLGRDNVLVDLDLLDDADLTVVDVHLVNLVFDVFFFLWLTMLIL